MERSKLAVALVMMPMTTEEYMTDTILTNVQEIEEVVKGLVADLENAASGII